MQNITLSGALVNIRGAPNSIENNAEKTGVGEDQKTHGFG